MGFDPSILEPKLESELGMIFISNSSLFILTWFLSGRKQKDCHFGMLNSGTKCTVEFSCLKVNFQSESIFSEASRWSSKAELVSRGSFIRLGSKVYIQKLTMNWGRRAHRVGHFRTLVYGPILRSYSPT